ncbi:hypothetical protein LWM68_46730 [Niabella sp. W65]|nr:hypothetical protein [Niabella sp. W65]MCH7369567.1 hypothetical protein [Niabella sp. W65]ULT45109.1 hypothetical protein KRR40_18510 [Niabella sp. I65]
MFTIKKLSAGEDEAVLKQRLQNKDALLGLVIPQRYTADVLAKSEHVAGQALQSVAVNTGDSTASKLQASASVVLFYHPVLQASFRQGIDGALSSVLQIVQSKYIVRQLYSAINDSAAIPADLEQQILTNQTPYNSCLYQKMAGMLL